MMESARIALRRALGATVVLTLVTLGAAAQASPWVEVPIVDDARFRHFGLRNIHFRDHLRGWAYGSGSAEVTQGLQFVLARTADGGRTWDETEISRDEGGRYVRPHFVTPVEGWTHDYSETDVLGPVAHYRTRDGGESWTLRQGDIVDVSYAGDTDRARWGDLRSLSVTHFLNTQVGFMAGGLNDGYRGYAILSTRGGGATWSGLLYGATPHPLTDHVSGPGMPWSIDFVDNTHGWIGIEGGWPGNGLLFRTQDGGTSWEVIEFSEGERDSLFGRRTQFVTPTLGWSAAGSLRHMMQTWDGGRTWAEAGMIADTFVFTSRATGWALGRSDTHENERASRIYRTDDAASTWHAEHITTGIGEDAFAEPFHSVNEREWRMIYSPSTGAIWALGPGGSAWQRALTVTNVAPRSKGLTSWAHLKQQEGLARASATE